MMKQNWVIRGAL